MKTIDQLVTEQLHHIAEKCESDPRLLKSTTPEIVAASLLCEIAHSGHAAYALKALAALGIATSLAEVEARFAAVREKRAAAFRAAGVDPVAEAEAKRRDDPLLKFFDSIEVEIRSKLNEVPTSAAAATPAEPASAPSPVQAPAEAAA